MPATPSNPGPCNPACTKVIKFMTDQDVPPSTVITLPPFVEIDGYRYINIFVQFSQVAATEAPVDLGVQFAFEANGQLSARRYVNLEANLSSQQSTNFIQVSGQDSWTGSPPNTSNYVARFPVMGPFIEVVVRNQAPLKRKVSVWGYLVS